MRAATSLLALAALLFACLVGSTLAASTYTVSVAPDGSLSYSPNVVTISPGDTVSWVWSTNSGRHDVVQSDSESSCSKSATSIFASDVVGPPSTFNFTFTAPGTYYYICTVGTHCAGGMKAKVVVLGSSGSTTAAPTATTSVAPTTTSKPASASRGEAGMLALGAAAVAGAALLF